MKLRMDALHYALLAVVVLLTVYCSTLYFREGAKATQGGKAAGFINITGELSSEVAKAGRDIKNEVEEAL